MAQSMQEMDTICQRLVNTENKFTFRPIVGPNLHSPQHRQPNKEKAITTSSNCSADQEEPDKSSGIVSGDITGGASEATESSEDDESSTINIAKGQ